jgi:Uncharacterized low-complexity proteins
MDQEFTASSQDEWIDQSQDNALLEDLILTDADLTQTVATGLTLNHCRLVNVDLTDVDWGKLHCQSTSWVNCRFTRANLGQAVFENCSFFDAEHAIGCNFSHSRLRDASFKKCDLSSCLFEGADLFRCQMQDSRAIGAKFFRAKFNNSAKITHCDLKYADLRGANFAKCTLSENNFSYTLLDEADFSLANLLGSDLGGATTRYTKFSGADLRGANLSSLDIRGLEMQGAKILESQMRRLLENCELIIFPDNH